jgi:hypothetical protein
MRSMIQALLFTVGILVAVIATFGIIEIIILVPDILKIPVGIFLTTLVVFLGIKFLDI